MSPLKLAEEYAAKARELGAIDWWHEGKKCILLSPDQLEAFLGRVSAPDGWMPIETAPLDNKARLVWCPERQNIYCVSWHGAWLLFGGGSHGWLTEQPTHWMPLPAPPSPAAKD